MNLKEKIDREIFRSVGTAADNLGIECYAVGGYIRDLFLNRHSKDIDFVAVGSGIEVAKELARIFPGKKPRVNVFRNFGTAQMIVSGEELEFVGARKESYSRDSRKPVVEDGTLDDDLSRRDFTINALAVRVNSDGFGELADRFNGLGDLEKKIIRATGNPDIIFSDDPLRMLRAIRFATQLRFSIDYTTFEGIRKNAERIKIISGERIYVELNKIMASPVPSIGWMLLEDCGLLRLILPELYNLKGVETVGGRGHKDNFYHTLQVLDKVAKTSDDIWLRWAALLHDIGKASTKKWIDGTGWTFYNHNIVGAYMIPKIFRRLRFPMDEKMKFVQKLVELHMRPIALVEDYVTDSAVRRLIVDAGEDLDSLMTLCEADITSKNSAKVSRFLENYAIVRQKIIDLDQKDQLRKYQPPVDGNEIMEIFNLTPSRTVGELKTYVREKLLDSDTPNDRDFAMRLLFEKAAELGLEPVKK